jgi:hypothetical protein
MKLGKSKSEEGLVSKAKQQRKFQGTKRELITKAKQI